ncbi:hypothetical protein D9756_008042 [Leucocoprinus leucothites]|uniref:Uncharacterized protein n=1 Tax=Leucocoprinus leucothites TaxID=201217 RepID=A0A8H5D4B6_9AGAR|nr:hypothetical protein D9756_008042 [Leucoagaricus leucothites]
MFSSIASFLPSALHIGPSDAQRPPQFSQDDPASEDEHDDLQGSRSKQPVNQPQTTTKSREKSANESFIIVRPPPSKSNHPLNLQVQLVPPNTKPPNGVVSQSNASFKSAATGTDHTLTRISSLRSEASYTNYASSTSSFSSVASSGSTRRTIVPLYNLQAHNVMTNVIVDAGTDAKIARFQRRGIVLIDLASLEPVEVWGDSPSYTGRTSINLNVDDPQPSTARNSTLSTRSGAPSSRAHTPEPHPTTASSAISLTSAKQSTAHPSHQNILHAQPQHQTPHIFEPPPSSDADSDSTPTLSTPRPQPPSQTKRNIFGKLFQSSSSKKHTTRPNPSPSPSPISASFAIPRLSHESSQTTPKPSLQLHSTNSGRSEKTHGRNTSLTTFISPIKSTLMSNKNKLSTVITGSSSSSSLNINAPSDQGIGLGITSTGVGGEASPNMSASSLAATSESVESGSAAHSSLTGGNPLLQVPSHLQPPTHSHQSSTGSTNASPPQTQLQQLQSRPPVLGIQPTYVSALGSSGLLGLNGVKKIRALMYVWLVRKWLKRSPQDERGLPLPNMIGRGGIFSGLGARGKDEEHHVHSEEAGAGVEVRFEWKRAKAKGSGRGRAGKEVDRTRPRKRRSIATAGEWDHSEGREEAHTQREKSRDSRERDSEDKRLSSLSVKSNQSTGSGVGPEDGGEGRRRRSLKRPKSAGISGVEGFEVGDGGNGKDDGEESDPEDSETPWVCTLKVRRIESSAHTRKSSGEKEVLKLKLGTLSPTPHHPKVVAMLKVPFPLPDIEVERLSLRRRAPAFTPGQGGVNELGEVRQTSSNSREPSQSPPGSGQEEEYKGLELSAEELKDIVCSTALWLIVREGTGGVGRVSRKGDGWKLRS